MPLPAALPPIVPQPFAENAPPGNINAIPNTTGVSGLASYDQGFPTITMQPVVGGGIPPEGQDFNGILFAITAHLYYLQSGQRWPFNATVATAIGGYPVGAIVAMADGTGEWVNLTAANSTNPDSAPPGAGGSGWTTLTSVGVASVPGLTGASPVTLTAAQGKKPIIVFAGTLTSNQAVTLPDTVAEWILVNLCTGAFNLTANCGGGVGQTVPQGGYGAPLGVYSIGDGNLYPSVSPLGVPISQAATPNTLAERTNAGYLLATYFNQSSSSSENPPIGAIFVENNSADGFLRKATLAYFEASMLLSAIGGQVTAGQVPQAAVTQYTPQILASAALTGVPTAPTAAPGTSTTQIATTAFVNQAASLTNNGYQKFPSGLIMQWGNITKPAANDATITFPVPFPTNCAAITMSEGGGDVAPNDYLDCVNNITTTGFTFNPNKYSAGSANPTVRTNWIAVGY